MRNSWLLLALLLAGAFVGCVPPSSPLSPIVLPGAGSTYLFGKLPIDTLNIRAVVWTLAAVDPARFGKPNVTAVCEYDADYRSSDTEFYIFQSNGDILAQSLSPDGKVIWLTKPFTSQFTQIDTVLTLHLSINSSALVDTLKGKGLVTSTLTMIETYTINGQTIQGSTVSTAYRDLLPPPNENNSATYYQLDTYSPTPGIFISRSVGSSDPSQQFSDENFSVVGWNVK